MLTSQFQSCVHSYITRIRPYRTTERANGPSCAALWQPLTDRFLAGLGDSFSTTYVPYFLIPRGCTSSSPNNLDQVSHDHIAHHFFSYAPFCTYQIHMYGFPDTMPHCRTQTTSRKLPRPSVPSSRMTTIMTPL